MNSPLWYGLAGLIALLSLGALWMAWVARRVARRVEKCGVCRYHDRGACKRYPPARVYIPGPQADSPVADVTVWPIVREDNWCGGFRR